MRRTGARLVGFGVGAVVIVVAAFLVYDFLVLPAVLRWKPELSLAKAAEAYSNHDLPTFKRYVDIQSVLDDAIDQIAPSWTASAIKATFVPGLVSETETQVSRGSGSTPSGSTLRGSEGQPGQLAELADILRRGLATEAKFDGFGVTSFDQDDAHLEVRMLYGTRIVPIHVLLHWIGDHWKVTAIEKVAATVDAVETAPAVR